MIVAVVVVLALAAAAGFWAQRLLLGRRSHDDPLARIEGLPISELVIPVRTLAALLLAFVLVAVFQSYQDAGDEAAEEAAAVLAMAEDAVLLTPDARRDVLGRLSCYTRAVVGPDWRAQNDDARPSPIADAAADSVTLALQAAAADQRNGLALGAILSSNSDRIRTRIDRFAEAQPSVPTQVWGLLLVTVSVTVGGLAALGHPGARRRLQLAVLAGTTAVFALTLLLVHDLDRPYDGAASIEPAAMQNVARRIAALPGAEPAPPCDADGSPS